MLVPWTLVQPSRRARQLRLIAIVIAALSSLSLLAAAIVSTPLSVGLALLAALTAAAGWTAARARAKPSFEIGVSPAAQIEVRDRDAAATDTPPPAVRVVFAAPWLISLRRGTTLIPIWPDCLPPAIYRQLWVHLHWGRTMPSDDDRRPAATERSFADH